ncbi:MULTISPECIES: isocitrate lyase/PEP mutase family protein [Alcaligenes]|uniref:isocitrate lyase/PEP mutase family protein n=1 Tax=Alcaligenes sp. SJTW-7 TaxID=3078429 RepID=UPI000269E994|nr:methylisocitrate lyase [Alcaligenes faecalis subsp. faecalis NCIB 8687]WGQ34190.1 isocitrate lyase/phosphoenolpyruvate mutase family protein [Alcaligenes faecalis]HRK87404.1 isocitrate lyase/phosphoenolpyruvate mutase family protein [Alcaligenes faecalis]
MSVSTQEKRRRFRALHENGLLILPNPWDIGSARRLERMGAQALASSSAAFAWSRGLEDFEVGRDALLGHLRELSACTSLPINADFENGFADEPEHVATNVSLAIETGIAGLSIEDRQTQGLYDLDLAVARMRAAKQAIRESGEDVMLVGRCEGLLIGALSLEETIARLQAFAAAGADVVYAPGLRVLDDIARLVRALAPTPVNVLLIHPGLTVPDLAAIGVRRVSTGSQLALASWNHFEQVSLQLLEQGHLPPTAAHRPWP